jgi:hypothetical protein
MANITFRTDVQTLRNLAAREEQRKTIDAAKRLRKNSKRSKPRQPGTGPKVVSV